MRKFSFSILMLLCSVFALAQKASNFTYSSNMANESLRGKPLVVKGELIAVQEGSTDYYYFLEKGKDKNTIISVRNEGDFFKKDAPKYVTDVNYYYFSPQLLKKITFEADTPEEGTYTIMSKDNTNIPFEAIREGKIKKVRHGFGEKDEEGYELMGIQMIYVGKFKSKEDFEKFQKNFLNK